MTHNTNRYVDIYKKSDFENTDFDALDETTKAIAQANAFLELMDSVGESKGRQSRAAGRTPCGPYESVEGLCEGTVKDLGLTCVRVNGKNLILEHLLYFAVEKID